MMTAKPTRSLFSSLKEAYWKAWYSYVCASDRNNELAFLNYGYQGPERPGLRPEDERNRYAIQLYDKVIRAIPGDPAEMMFLEVGCGRGGGISYVARYLEPKRVIGVDICSAAIEFCENTYKNPNISFFCGDASNLPVNENEVDVVINVESSHRYPDMSQFLSEVRRVLKPQGHLSFVDFRARELMGRLRGEFENSGLEIISEEGITHQILKALDLDNPRRLALIDRLMPKILHKPAREFAAVVGSASYRSLAEGEREYVRFLLKNP